MRIKSANPGTPLIVCTSDLDCDIPIFELCVRLGVECFRGSHLNVASRYFEISHNTQFDGFVRICADSPMVDGHLVRKIIEAWSDKLDILTNKSPRTFPKGQSIEIVNRETYIQSYQFFESNDDFEHVTHYFHRNLENFTFRNIYNSVDHSKFSLAIDEPMDLSKFETFVTRIGASWIELSHDDILALYRNAHND